MTGDDLAALYALAHDPDTGWMAQALCLMHRADSDVIAVK